MYDVELVKEYDSIRMEIEKLFSRVNESIWDYNIRCSSVYDEGGDKEEIFNSMYLVRDRLKSVVEAIENDELYF